MIYRLTYDQQGCYDDGGLGHEVGWHFNRHATIEADDDNHARNVAQKWIQDHSGKHPCYSGCGNYGIYRLTKIEAVIPEKVREISLSGSGK